MRGLGQPGFVGFDADAGTGLVKLDPAASSDTMRSHIVNVFVGLNHPGQEIVVTLPSPEFLRDLLFSFVLDWDVRVLGHRLTALNVLPV